jgi:hypothetical protein
MRKTKIIFGIGLVLILFFNFSFADLPGNKGKEIQKPAKGVVGKAEDLSIKNQQKQEGSKSSVALQVKNTSAANFILVTDVLDGFGGQRYNGGCDLSIFAGGQSSAIGPGTSTNYNLYAGFIYPIVVTCGDANGDGKLSVSDVVYLINYLFKGGPAPIPWEAGEANCDGKVTVSDVVYLINYLFKGGPPPIC